MPLKVLFLHRTLRASGAVRQMLNLFHRIDRERFDPFYVLWSDTKVADRSIFDAARVHVLARHRNDVPWRLVRRMVEVLDLERPDLIQSFNPRSNRLLYLSSLVRRLPPLYCSVRNTNQSPSDLWSEYLFQRRPRAMVVNSEGIRQHLIRDGGIRPSRIRLIPNGVDVDQFTPCDDARRRSLRAALGFEPDAFVVLTVGRVDPQKNVLCAAEGVAQLAAARPDRRVRFVCVGRKRDTGYGGRVSALLRERGMEDRSLFAGIVPDVADYYRAADAMVLASDWEGLPNVVVENMACGGISVVSQAADNDLVVNDGANGFLFAAGDAGALARRLEEVMELRESDRIQIAERARKDVVERFSLERMVRSFEELWLEGLRSRP